MDHTDDTDDYEEKNHEIRERHERSRRKITITLLRIRVIRVIRGSPSSFSRLSRISWLILRSAVEIKHLAELLRIGGVWKEIDRAIGEQYMGSAGMVARYSLADLRIDAG
jgi:hypothetical protein